jgi:probable phosphoglycerate mutase
MTTFILVRHGECNHVNRYLAGRAAGIHLNEKGKNDITELGYYLSRYRIDKIYTSPMERTIETAQLINRKMGMEIIIDERLNEIEYGGWTGKYFTDLEECDAWKEFNCNRLIYRIPGGEMFSEVENRMVSFVLEHQSDKHTVNIVVSHSDPIKCLLSYWGGIPIEIFNRIEIATASMSIIIISQYDAQITGINLVADK